MVKLLVCIKVAIQELPRSMDEHDSFQESGDAITTGDTSTKYGYPATTECRCATLIIRIQEEFIPSLVEIRTMVETANQIL